MIEETLDAPLQEPSVQPDQAGESTQQGLHVAVPDYHFRCSTGRRTEGQATSIDSKPSLQPVSACSELEEKRFVKVVFVGFISSTIEPPLFKLKKPRQPSQSYTWYPKSCSCTPADTRI